jgi:hypothetical protein
MMHHPAFGGFRYCAPGLKESRHSTAAMRDDAGEEIEKTSIDYRTPVSMPIYSELTAPRIGTPLAERQLRSR